MSMALLIAGIISAIAIAIGKGFDEEWKRIKWLWWIPISFFVLLMITGSFATVPAGHRGVLLRFNTVQSTLNEGLNVKLPLIDKVVRMSVQTQLYSTDATSASKDMQDVKTSIGLNYRLDPKVVGEVYRTLGVDYIDRIASPAVQETVKAVTARYNAEDMILKREQVKGDITDGLTTRLAERGIITEIVSITNFEFSPEFTKAIEDKVIAYQNYQQAQNKLLQVQVEAQQAKAKAEGEAAAILTKATAQDEANKILTQNLSPELLQYILIDRLAENVKVMIVPSGQALTVGGIEALLQP